MNHENQHDPTPPEMDAPRMSRLKQMKYVGIIGLMLLFGIFLGKNFTPIEIWLFGWTLSIPLVLVALTCFGIGVLTGLVAHMFYRRRLEEE